MLLFLVEREYQCYLCWLNANAKVIFCGCMGIPMLSLVFPYNQKRKHWHSITTNKDNIGIPIQPRKITLVFPFNQKRKHWYSHTTKKITLIFPFNQKDNIGISNHSTKITLVFPYSQKDNIGMLYGNTNAIILTVREYREYQCYFVTVREYQCFIFGLNGNTNVIFLGCTGIPMLSFLLNGVNKDNIGIPIQLKNITLLFPFNQ
jgi:hypothetical protein